MANQRSSLNKPPRIPVRYNFPIVPVSPNLLHRRKSNNPRFGGKECLQALWKYKWVILVAVIISGSSPFLRTKVTGHRYRAEATIAPRSGMRENDLSRFLSLGNRRWRRQVGKMNRTDEDYAWLKLKTTARSRRFGQYIYDKYGQELVPLVFFRRWDAEKNEWRKWKKKPTRNMIIRRMGRFARIKAEKRSQFMHVRSVHSNPETAKYLVNLYLKEISEFLRNDIITEAKNLQRFLDETARKTDDVFLKKKLYRMLNQAQDKMLFAYAHTPYGFKVIDPAVVPDRDKYIRPKYLRNCLFSVTGAFLWMAGMAVAIEFFRFAKPYVSDPK